MNETGIGIQNPLFFVGVVENNVDSRLEGRVQVRAFGVHGTTQQVPTESLPWATLIHGSYDPNAPIPPLNSWVFGFFVDGREAQQPMILGLIPTQMTEEIDPDRTGWGVIPTKDGNVRSQGTRPTDFGQPQNSRLARGENVEETYALLQEMNRKDGVKIAGTTEEDDENSWSEPASAYNAEYPFNRVIETASGHSIELDDTPGAERIMIWHKSGSYVQIDSRGTKTDKSVSDKYEVNDKNHHVYVGGKSVVTIEGDCRVLVKGNKIEEIAGDLVQIVRGNHLLSVAGQINFNAGLEVQTRGAQIRMESNVAGINMKAAKDVLLNGKSNIHIKSDSGGIYHESEGDVNIKSAASLFLNSSAELHAMSADVRIGGGSKISINASEVAIDDVIKMSNGDTDSLAPAIGANSSASTELPMPPAKSTSISNYRNRSSTGTVGYISQDDGVSTVSLNQGLDVTVSKTILAPLLDLIGKAEGAGYDTVYGGSRIQPPRAITTLTIKELLEWQDRSAAAGSKSTASGRYQVIRSTLSGVITGGAVSLDDRYDPATQDKIAEYLLMGRGLGRYLSGDLSKEGFANNLSQEWASFPVATGVKAGYSYYEGIAGNKSRTTISEVYDALQKVIVAFRDSSDGVMV